MTNPVPQFHLRRVFYDSARASGPPELILLGASTKFGRNAENVDVVLTSAVYSNMISRNHACIMGKVENGRIVGHTIKDTSLNGTYINDKRVKESEVLKVNDIIKFGHMNGAAIKPGSSAPQANAEFAFMFEQSNPSQSYVGWIGTERKRTVVCSGNGTAMQEANFTRRQEVTSTSSMASSVSLPCPPQFAPPSVPSPNDPLLQQMFIYSMLRNNQQNQFPLMSPYTQPSHLNFQQNLMPHMNGVLTAHPSPSPSLPLTIPPSREESKPSSTSGPSTLNTPVECDSSVPSPPKPTSALASTSNKGEEEELRVPDTPPRAPLPPSPADRSVTYSPAPPSPAPVLQPRPEKKPAVPKKPAGHPGKAPKGAGGEKRANEVARLLNDLTEGSYAAVARRNSTGAGSERRRLQDEGKKVKKKEAKQNKLLRQLSDVSSEGSDSEEEVKPKKPRKQKKKKSGKGKGGSDESEPYEDSDEDTKPSKPAPAKKNTVTKSTKTAKSTQKATKELEYSNFEDTVDTTCALPTCKKPTLEHVNWVQCDRCSGWFHNMCVFGDDSIVLPENKEFYCGCKKKKSTGH